MAEPTEIAWAAGLFEGEGSISVAVKTGRWVLRVKMSLKMTDEDVVRRFHSVVGVGGVSGPLRPSIEGGKPLYQWQSGSAPDCEATIRAFLPFFGVRRTARAMEALAYIEAHPPMSRIERAYLAHASRRRNKECQKAPAPTA